MKKAQAELTEAKNSGDPRRIKEAQGVIDYLMEQARQRIQFGNRKFGSVQKTRGGTKRRHKKSKKHKKSTKRKQNKKHKKSKKHKQSRHKKSKKRKKSRRTRRN